MSGTLAQRIGSKLVLLIGTLVSAAGYLVFALAHGSQAAVLVGST